MNRVILISLVIIGIGCWHNSFAQILDEVPHRDEKGNKIPWYAPDPEEEGQTRSTVDLRFAPADMKMIGPSPAAAGATKYIDCAVSYGLGQADINIPLYEIKSHSLSLPISLSYDSGGVRVDDISGPAGLGWTLEAGGVITRTVRGLADDTSTGWPYRPSGDPLGANYQNDTYLSNVSKGEADSSADIYSYNFCGHQGSFYIDGTISSYTIVPTCATDLAIEISNGGFTITDTDGTKYVFAEQETSARFTSITLPFYGAGSSPENYPQSTGPITAWYLTEIVAMDGTDVIKLYYKDTYGSLSTTHHANTRTYQVTYRYQYAGSYLWRTANGLWDSFPAVSYLEGAYETETIWTPHYLDRIIFAGGRVDFKYKQNTTSPSTERRSYPWILDYFTVKTLPPASSSATEVFRATFTLPFQSLDKRNLLTGVALTGRGGAAIETYTLAYINAGTAMDPNSKDLFGYYNGADNSNGTGFLRLFGNSNTFFEQVADRSYNSTYVSNLSLESIATSSGSKTKFQYEGNSVSTSAPDVLFSTLGIGHRIRRISTYDLSGGSETLVRKRDFTYSSPGITIPAYAFKHAAFMTLTEIYREDLVDGSPWWCLYSGYHPIPRTLFVAFSDQSVLPGVPLESARIYYGNVTERVSGVDASPSYRTDYVFDTTGAEYAQAGLDWILGTSHNSHDNDNNQPGGHLYHFFQRPPQTIPLNVYEMSLDLSPAWYYFVQEDFPQLTSPTTVRKYKWQGSTDKIVYQTTNEYSTNKDTLRVGLRVRNMLSLGDALYQSNVHHVIDYYRAGINQKIKWYRLTRTTETETLDDNSTQSAITTYTYLPASSPSTFIPAAGAILSPKTRTTVYGSSSNTRTYTWSYMYPSEVAGGTPWAAQLVARGYKRPFVESVTADNVSTSATSSRVVTWAAFAPPDTTGMTIYRPSTVSITRREPGSSTTNTVGPNVTYGAYDRWGNPLQISADGQPVTTYIWGYGGLRPVLEIAGGTYTQARSAIGVSSLNAIVSGTTSLSQLTGARANLEAATSAKMLVCWYLYDLPFGITQASDVSSRVTKYTYDGAGRLVSVLDESSSRVSSYSYALTNGGSGTPNSINSYIHTIYGSSATSGVRDVTYFDGLGRTVQTIAVGASTSSKDLVTPATPDFLDHEDTRVYNPYPASGTAGAYRSGALAAQQSYYGSGVKAFTENTYEISSRNRIVASSLPGFTETTTASTASSAASTVLKLSYNASANTISAAGYYAANRFIVTTTIGPDGSQSSVYTDELGTPVLERVKINATTWADTYYIKDVLGRVLCVVPPAEASKLSSSTSGYSATYCYTYAYDSRDRVTKRQLPGCTKEDVSYNEADQPVTRTRLAAGSTSVNEVFTTTYDAFFRPVSETYKYGSNTAVTLAEYQYDTYPSWAPAFASESGYVTSKDTRVRGMKTAERITLLPANVAPSALTTSNTATKESRAFYYDAKARVVQFARINVQGGTDRISSSYGFAGNVLKERQKIQPASGTSTYNLDRTYTYDTRLRLTNVSASLNGGSTATQAITYDDLQRLSTLNRGSGTETTTFSYTLQGWPYTALSTSWEEVMLYATPPHSATSGLPGKAGLVTEWRQQQKGTTANGATASAFFAFSYDLAGRLTGSVRYPAGATSPDNIFTEQGITYDRSGNLTALSRYGSSGTVTQSLSYTYNGPQRTTWTYDNHGNVTSDPQSSMTLAWNVLDLPRTLTSGSASTQRGYLADGTLAQIYDGSTTRLYLGDMVFTRTGTSGTPVLESAGWEGGRLVNGSGTSNVLYYVADHLGSVRVVKDGAGTIRQRFDYYPFGATYRSWTSSSTMDSSEKRFRFGGKEIAGTALTELSGAGAAPGAPYLDFGARLYSPKTATWLSVDPLAEKYCGIGQYVYCAGNPVNFVDPEGTSTWVYYDLTKGVYIVFGGELNDDLNIYEFFPDNNGEYTILGTAIGSTLTPTSFFDSDYNEWKGFIDLNELEGIDFLAKMINKNGMPKHGIVNYIDHARTNHKYDFKANGEMYRGMPIKDGVYASARDIGNYVAGYYAAANGIPWQVARFAFDLYQGNKEGISSQNAQHLGWSEGNQLNGLRKGLNVSSSYVGARYFDSKAFIWNTLRWAVKK